MEREGCQTDKDQLWGVFAMGFANGLECDDDMGDAGHGVRGLSIGGEVVISPEDLWFICLGRRVKGRGVYLGVDGGVDNPTHGTS